MAIGNGESNRTMLSEFLFTTIEEECLGDIRFQQYDAPCHTANVTIDFFEDRIISRNIVAI